ncbi:Hypothetical protein NAEGRDRAFT_78329 [Naegleria gruberi]|uniref:Glycosyltransferase family 18 catalytic domain-containing protein n=1 Tax=Naegleria gruberi TaxID=5762 RepID=D2V2S5_NAEGR|nr:uncharacterized protein NAEGRDRAFT_78329 [Naegleria gruberi]EFC48948.1 Hypothetical protein NAEGRDRAFT_78329 [Naegleria gruberi]|eukprot:XP_002681692.1 Hypothetical protein NAEGRDRAFT_78329 [Naegleria gruberi strain NEG-M]
MKFKQQVFNPCILIYNSKGKIYKDQIEKIVNRYPRQYISIIHNSYSFNMFMNAKITPKQKSQSNSFYDMVKNVNNQISLISKGGSSSSGSVGLNSGINTKSGILDANIPVVLMQDDYVLCDSSISHLSLIFEKATHLEEQGKDWAGFRFSYGMSGIMMQQKDLPNLIEYLGRRSDTRHTIQHLLDNFFDNTKKAHQDYFKGRYFYTYRFQLLRPNYHFNLEKSHFPQCFEPQTHLVIESCSHSLFFPCEGKEQQAIDYSASTLSGNSNSGGSSGGNSFSHDVLQLAAFPASHKHSISDFKNVESIPCEKGESCNACCRKVNALCDANFFSYINRCDEMQRFAPKCNCKYQRGLIVESVAPYFNDNTCVLGSRVSKFNCHNSDSTVKRLCPCTEKIIDRTD